MTTFLTQLMRQAADAGYQVRELIPNATLGGEDNDQFRAGMRRQLDAEMAGFDPQVIHVQGIGVLGHLALETGAPYLISAFAEELASGQIGSTVRVYAQQAIENAGRIVVDTSQARQQLLSDFGDIETILVAEELDQVPTIECSFDWLWQIYREIAAARRGQSFNR